MVAMFLWIAGCVASTSTIPVPGTTGGETSSPPGPTSTTAGTTWQADVRPLVDEHCGECHVEGGIAPYVFDDPTQLSVLGPLMVDAVQTRVMPPWSFQPGCREVADDPSLSDDEIAVFTAWAANDYAIGDEADYVPPDLPERVEPPPADLEAHPVAPFEPNTSQPDDYLCVVTDAEVDQEQFVAWSEIRPERVDIVHHAFAYAVPPEQIPALSDIAGGDLDHPFPCWESPVVYIGPTIAGWVPGGQPDYAPTHDVVRVPAGSKIVLEVHFNMLAATGPLEDVVDHTSLDLWTVPEDQVQNVLVRWSAINFGIQIPANDDHVLQLLNLRLPIDGPIVQSAPHMHLLGTQVHSVVHHAVEDTEQCVSIVDWDFSWQRDYPVVDEIPFSATAGDSVDLTCVYDNSAAHQPIVDGVRQESRDVEWGDSSLDEMCIDFLTFKVPFDPSASSGLCWGYDKCWERCAPDDPDCPVRCMGMAGEACFTCGVFAMEGPCTARHCAREAAPYLACLASCDELESDFHGCQVEQCATQFAAYQACAQPLFADGTCASDYAACSGLVP